MNRRQYLVFRFYVKQVLCLVLLACNSKNSLLYLVCVFFASNKQIQVNNHVKAYQTELQIEGRCNWPSDEWKTERVVIYEFPSLSTKTGDITRYYIHQNKSIVSLKLIH